MHGLEMTSNLRVSDAISGLQKILENFFLKAARSERGSKIE